MKIQSKITSRVLFALVFLSTLLLKNNLGLAAGNLTPLSELKRQQAMQAEYSLFQARTLSFDATKLSEVDKKFLQHLQQAAQIIEELYLLQLHPRNLEFRARVFKSGNELEQKIFTRNRGPWCLLNEDPLCNALPFLPEARTAWHLWPEAMNEATLKLFQKHDNKAALLSPFSIVRLDAKANPYSIAYVSSPLLSDRMKLLAKELRSASGYADTKSLKKFLRSRARAFERKSIYPYDKSDLDWINVASKWELTIGPYETYRDPMNVKAMFTFILGMEDKIISKDLAIYEQHLQKMEEQLANILGAKRYRARKINPATKVRAIRVLQVAGDGKKPHGATVAYHLPNRGEAMLAGLSKKVVLIDHLDLAADLLKVDAIVLLGQKQGALFSELGDIHNTALHEFAHGLGAQTGRKIQRTEKDQTIQEALGTMTNVMEELKAEALSLYLLDYMQSEDLLSTEQAHARYVTAIVHLFKLLQHSLQGPYAQMAAIKLGYLIDNQVLNFQKSGYFEIDFSKLPAVLTRLVKEIANIQLDGDKKLALALRAQYLQQDPATNKYQLTKKLAQLSRVVASLNKQTHSGFSVEYKISGL